MLDGDKNIHSNYIKFWYCSK